MLELWCGSPRERMEDRRQFVRINSQLVVSYRVIGERGEGILSVTQNLSRGGICFLTDAWIAPETVLQIDVRIPQRQQLIRFTAEVVWSGALLLEHLGQSPHRFQTGVRFVEIAETDQQLLLQYPSVHNASAAPSH